MKRTLILPVLLALAACSGHDKPTLERVKTELAAQDYAAATHDLFALLKDDPKNRELLTLLAQAQLRQGDGDGAQSTVERLKAIGANGPEIAEMEAEAALARGQAQQALTLLGDGATVNAWRVRAAAKLKLGDGLGALKAYQAGLAGGGDALIALDYARYLLTAGEVEAAAAQYEQVKQAQPGALSTFLLAGDIAVSAGQPEQALDTYAAASKAFPARVEPLLAAAVAHDILGQLDKAKARLAQAEELEPGNARVAALQLQLAGESGDWEKVRSTLAARESTLEPNSGEGMAYAEALLRLGHPEQARAIFQNAVLVSPSNPYSRLRLGEAQLATGDGKAAWQTLKPLGASILTGKTELELIEKAARAAGDPAADALKARVSSPQFAAVQALVSQGQAALFKRDWAAAAAAYGQLAQQAQEAEVYKRLAQALSHLGRHDEAIGWADKALALEPGNVDMQYMAGQARSTAGRDGARAIELLKGASAADPGNPLFQGALAKAQAAAG